MNSTASFVQVQTTNLYPTRNSSSSRGEHELVVFLEKYYSLFLLIFGTVGNLLCLAVLSRGVFRRSSAGIYLRFLTLSDLAAIYTGVLFFTARALFNNNFRKTDELSCKFHRWLSFTACDLSSWALVLVSTARLLSIAWPMKRLITRSRVYASILVTVIVLFGANLPIFIIYGDVRDPVRNRTSLCVFTQESYEDFYIYVFSWLVLVKFGFLPAVLLIVLNAALVLSVARSGRAVKQLTSHKSHPVTSSGPAARNLKTRSSIRKGKLETGYSSNNNPDLDSSELSTGSSFSDRSLSTSDVNEVSVTNPANSHLSGAWNKMLVHLKLKGSHQIDSYRLAEGSLRKLFCGIQMMWQRDDLDSQKDLVSLDEDVSNCSLRTDSTVDEQKEANIACTETNLSGLDEEMKSGTENIHGLTRTKTPGKEHVLTENTINMADGPGVRRTCHGLNNYSDSHVILPALPPSTTSMGGAEQSASTTGRKTSMGGAEESASTTGRKTSMGGAEALPTATTLTVSDHGVASSSSNLRNNHCSSDVEKTNLQHDVNTTTQQPTTNLHTTLSSNNLWTLCGRQVDGSQAQTGQGVLDNCLSQVTDVGLRPLLGLHISHNITRRRTSMGEQVGREDKATSSDYNNHLKPATRASLRDIHVRNVSTTNKENSSSNHDKDIDVDINSEIPSHGAYMDVPHRSSHNCLHVNHTQGHTHATCHHQLVCEYSMSETSSSPRDIGRNKGNNPPSLSCDSCRGTAVAGSCRGTAVDYSCRGTAVDYSCRGTAAGCAKDTDSTTSSGLGERTKLESVPASTCTSQDNTTEPNEAATQVDQLTEQPVVPQKDTTNYEASHSVSRVDQLTAPTAVCRTNGCRRKSGLPRKAANKSRSLTRTLLVLNTVFLLCNTPITVYLTGKTYFWPDAVEYSDVQEIIVTVANFTMYTNNSINFILYCVTGSRFRGQLLLMFKELYHFLCNCARRLSRVNKQRS